MQTYTSANTSINSNKAPAIYSIKKAVEIMAGRKTIDIGGGKYDTGIKAAKAYNTTVSVYDPYNRTEAHNLSVLSSDYDIAIISNVLNVIDTDTERANVLNLASSKANTILITVYEGDGSGVGKATKDDCWQENRKTSDYVSEIQTVLTNYTVSRYGKLIVARKDV